MKEIVRIKLDKLREDFFQITGYRFIHFYCPILYKDEYKPLCMAHIVNTAFPNSARAWTVQREDVDNFYGSMFESDFTLLKHSKKYSPDEVLYDMKLSKILKPKILLNGNPVDYYYTEENIPEQFSPAVIDKNGETTKFALKMKPEAILAELSGVWETDFTKDLRLSALVSLIKSAHLTLFEILSYDYALTAGGNLVGQGILGNFYEKNKNKRKVDILNNALSYFQDFAHMVRPLSSNKLGFQGTISDYQFLICSDSNNMTWALIVFIKINQCLHAVLIPTFAQIEAIPKFLDFLKNDQEIIEVNFCRFKKGKIEISKDTIKLTWPKTGIIYP